jgi:hypothetical protein
MKLSKMLEKEAKSIAGQKPVGDRERLYRPFNISKIWC